MPETIAIGHWIHFFKKIAVYFGLLATSIGLDLHARPPLTLPPFHDDRDVLLPLKRSIYLL
jgi:hypothetical protein